MGRQGHLRPDDGRSGVRGGGSEDGHDRRDLSQGAPHGFEPAVEKGGPDDQRCGSAWNVGSVADLVQSEVWGAIFLNRLAIRSGSRPGLPLRRRPARAVARSRAMSTAGIGASRPTCPRMAERWHWSCWFTAFDAAWRTVRPGSSPNGFRPPLQDLALDAQRAFRAWSGTSALRSAVDGHRRSPGDFCCPSARIPSCAACGLTAIGPDLRHASSASMTGHGARGSATARRCAGRSAGWRRHRQWTWCQRRRKSPQKLGCAPGVGQDQATFLTPRGRLICSNRAGLR